jgi:hypothetical protein
VRLALARRWPRGSAPRPRPRAVPLLLLLLLAGLAPPEARADLIEVVWDQDQVFEHDRASYERQLRQLVERSYQLVSSETGLTLGRAIRLHVYSRGRYQKEFGLEAASTRGAHYRLGTIYLNGGNRLDDHLSGKLAHELTHAVLDRQGTLRNLPLWLDEGLAELLRWKHMGLPGLAPNQVIELQDQGRRRELVPLPTWGQLTWTYLQCHAAVLFLEKRAGREKLRALVRRTLDGEPFERVLDAELRFTPVQLDREFAAWVEHLG